MRVWLSIFKKHNVFKLTTSLRYNLTAKLLWEYTKRNYPSICLNLEEPREGNPARLYDKGKLISEDLANSILEYVSISYHNGEEGENKYLSDNSQNSKGLAPVKTIIELGGGYGRTAYVFLKLHPNIKYIMVDIPPTLWIAQKYLSSVFHNKNLFKFRHFNSYKEISEELEASDIAFLTPNQLEMLPDKTTDLFINVSSLHEMRPDQISYYFNQINRLTKEFFYFKQWKVSKIPYENIIIKENDYPIPNKWKRLYHRDCIFPSLFFEAMYEINE